MDACTGVILAKPMLETASRTHGDSGGLVRDSHDCFPGSLGASAPGAGAKGVLEGPLGIGALGTDFAVGFVGAILRRIPFEKKIVVEAGCRGCSAG